MWGLALLPGIRLNHTSLGYVRLGYSWLTLKGRVNITANNLVDLVPGSVFSTARKTDTSSGFNFGFGIETLLWENWSMRTEYTHYYYDSFTAASDPTGVTTTYNPSDNQFMLGFTYHVV
jgi:outer membrane immunogenic protein